MASSLQDSLVAVKKVAELFAPLATASADIDRLMALVSHEDELKKSIADKLNEKAQIDAACQQRVADADAAVAESKRIQVDTEAGYAERREALQREHQLTKETLRGEMDAAKAQVIATKVNNERELGELKAAYSAERQQITADHNVFIAETKTHRAQIEANTQALQDTLDSVRAELAPLMKD